MQCAFQLITFYINLKNDMQAVILKHILCIHLFFFLKSMIEIICILKLFAFKKMTTSNMIVLNIEGCR